MKPGAKFGYLAGLGLMALALLWLFLPGQESLHSLGPANTGHETLGCEDCHTPADGTARQQIQANVRYWVGLRDTPANFQHNAVTNDDCLACHERPNDAHPVFRFNEPRFAEARAAIQPQDCVSCHLEHEGERVTIEPTFCVVCHEDLELRNDPIDIPHTTLIADENWASCLGCHDFHGNHVMETETQVGNALPIETIEEYFAGSDSPYSAEKAFSATEERNE